MGEAFAILGLDLTRHRCNSHSVEESDGRVRRFCGHLENSEAPRLISSPKSQLWKMAKVFLPWLLSEPPVGTLWAYTILTSILLCKDRSKSRFSSLLLVLCECLWPSAWEEKEIKTQRWVSSVFQRDIGHLCIYSFHSRVTNKLYIVGQLQSNDKGSLECCVEKHWKVSAWFKERDCYDWLVMSAMSIRLVNGGMNLAHLGISFTWKLDHGADHKTETMTSEP